MKKFLITLFSSTLGSIFGSYLYTLIEGPAAGYGWGPTILLGLVFGTISYFSAEEIKRVVNKCRPTRRNDEAGRNLRRHSVAEVGKNGDSLLQPLMDWRPWRRKSPVEILNGTAGSFCFYNNG